MELSTAAIIEKNKIASNGADLLLCDITCRDESLHLVANNENIVFQGVTYYAYAFSVDKIKVSSTEMPSARLNISNITGSMQALLENMMVRTALPCPLKRLTRMSQMRF